MFGKFGGETGSHLPRKRLAPSRFLAFIFRLFIGWRARPRFDIWPMAKVGRSVLVAFIFERGSRNTHHG